VNHNSEGTSHAAESPALGSSAPRTGCWDHHAAMTKHEQCETRDQLFAGEELEKSFSPPERSGLTHTRNIKEKRSSQGPRVNSNDQPKGKWAQCYRQQTQHQRGNGKDCSNKHSIPRNAGRYIVRTKEPKPNCRKGKLRESFRRTPK
jgi:hypothetical protein